MEKVLREIPESVRVAKACGDVETLRRLGRAGARRRAQLKPVRDKQKAYQEIKASVADKAADTLIEEVLAAEHARILRAGAFAHAMSNRIGWDDSSD
jgi:hypothetical protein